MTTMRVKHKWTGDKGVVISRYAPNGHNHIRWDNPGVLLNHMQRDDMLIFIVPAGHRNPPRAAPIANTGPLDADIL